MEQRAPFRFQGAVCSFAFWECVLLCTDALSDATAWMTLLAPLLLAHACLAGVTCVVTLREDDLQSPPILQSLPGLVLPTQRGILERCPLLGNARTLTLISFYLGALALTRMSTSKCPFLWFSVFVLSLLVHCANLAWAALGALGLVSPPAEAKAKAP
mmetsp:Transcript_121155/g.377208  ORF Transcript_121155/g.377208 Transcript_121155/m.377208 type:complete len:158 (+) Transcript_121155:88-561(+)